MLYTARPAPSLSSYREAAAVTQLSCVSHYHFMPQRMEATADRTARSVCVSVGHDREPTKTDEPIEMPRYEVQTRVSSKEACIR